MRMARKRAETEASKEMKARGKITVANKCMKTTTKNSHKSGKRISREEDKSPCKNSEQSPSSVNNNEEAQQVPVLHPHSGKEVGVSGKIKLQLFPLDVHTLKGLQKDGQNPYLELTLRPRKKVSSVLKHIQSKWVNLEIAPGDPLLYPYDKTLFPSGHKWTANSKITIGDVYVAVGTPDQFRLRYAWSYEPPSTSTPDITCFQNVVPFTVVSSSRQVTDPSLSENTPNEQVEPTEDKTKDGSGPTLFSWDDGLTSLSIGGLLSEVSLKGNPGNHSKSSTSGNANATLWVDNLTNISIGGLFSEASLHREQESTHNNVEPSVSIGGLLSEASSRGNMRLSDGNKTWEERRATSQQKPLPLISDSLDAFLVKQTDKPRAQAPCHAPPPPAERSQLSILDSEDTCHAFSFRKRTTTSLKFIEQVSKEAEEHQQKDESKPGKGLFSSMVFNQDSSLGFSGIKWAESRGPFDFGLSLSSRKVTNGDSVSFGTVVKDLQENSKHIETHEQ